MSFKIECVITCANFSDMLSETLPTNRAIFDRMVVVTNYMQEELVRNGFDPVFEVHRKNSSASPPRWLTPPTRALDPP